VLAAGYYGWLRDSSLVGIEKVDVTGLTTPEAKRIRAALTAEARSMTTLHVDVEQLERAVGGFASVGSVRVETDFPHRIVIHVAEQRPAALALGPGDARLAIAPDGSVLPGARVDKELPTLRLDSSPADGRLTGRPLQAVEVLAAAPPALRERLRAVEHERGSGIVVRLRRGPKLIFGAPSRIEAKWAAAAAVLADPEARGATYVDLRIPERPAAGGIEAPRQQEPEEAYREPADGAAGARTGGAQRPGAEGAGARAGTGTTPGTRTPGEATPDAGAGPIPEGADQATPGTGTGPPAAGAGGGVPPGP
jgi:cell division protein FtsQ